MNVCNEVILKLASNPSKVVFEYLGLRVTADQFLKCIKNFELHMRVNGVDRSSCVALFADDVSIATALTLAVGLIGCKWVKISSSSVANVDCTHAIYYHEKKIINDGPNVIRVGKSWMNPPVVLPKIPTEEYNPKDIWMIGESSGTTGRTKFIELTYQNYFNRVFDDAKDFLSKRQKVWFAYHPLKSSVQYKAITAILNNLTVITKMGYRDLQSNPNTLIVGSLGQINALIDKEPPPRKPFNITVDVTGAATSKADAARFLKYFKEVRLCYGSTEASRSHQKTITHIDQYNGSVGNPLPSCKADIDANGVVRIWTPRTAAGYINGERFSEGWFTPNDTGEVVNGELFITGRTNDQLNKGGVKIDPVEIETIMNSVYGVERSMLFVDEFNLCAIIVGKAEAKSIYEKCLNEVEISKIPVCYYFSDSLPMNENGKYSRREANQFVSNLQPVLLA